MEPTTSSPPIRIGVLGSGSGTTVARLLDAAGSMVHARVCVEISNSSRSGAFAHAREHDLLTIHLSSATHPDPVALDAAMVDALASAGAEIVVLARAPSVESMPDHDRTTGRPVGQHRAPKRMLVPRGRGD